MRLDDVAGGSERALRDTAYFDPLVRHHAEVATRRQGGAGHSASAPQGLPCRTDCTPDSEQTAVTSPPRTGVGAQDLRGRGPDRGRGQVWPEQDGEPRELDNLILERMTVATVAVLDRQLKVSTHRLRVVCELALLELPL